MHISETESCTVTLTLTMVYTIYIHKVPSEKSLNPALHDIAKELGLSWPNGGETLVRLGDGKPWKAVEIVDTAPYQLGAVLPTGCAVISTAKHSPTALYTARCVLYLIQWLDCSYLADSVQGVPQQSDAATVIASCEASNVP